MYLCQPWDMEEISLPPHLAEDTLNEEESGSEMSDFHQSSDDSRSFQSLEINFDYMAYVKRTDTLASPNAKPRLVNGEQTEVRYSNIHLRQYNSFKSLHMKRIDGFFKLTNTLWTVHKRRPFKITKNIPFPCGHSIIF